MSQNEVKRDSEFFKREIQKLKEEYCNACSKGSGIQEFELNRMFNRLKFLSAIVDFEIRSDKLL